MKLGIRENAPQFALLVAINALVGAMVGLERGVLPASAEEVFGVEARWALLSFIGVFGVTKALANYAAGELADRIGRRRLLIAGWLVGVPVPFLLATAPSWSWVTAANALLGVSQGLAWSATVIMKVDLAGPKQRGLAMGLNEAAGYLAVAGSAALAGYVAAGSDLFTAMGFGFAYTGFGLLLSAFFARETAGFVKVEAGDVEEVEPPEQLALHVTLREPSLSSAVQAGFFNNLNDGVAWGLFPLVYLGAGMDWTQIGWLAAIYPGVWGLGQLVTGGLSDVAGRKPLLVVGMLTQALAIATVVWVSSFVGFAVSAALLGAGTAMVYPTLLAVIGDVAAPHWRGRAIGIYRFWRDIGYAIGALGIGIVADQLGLEGAVVIVAALTLFSGLIVAVRLRETVLRFRPQR